jgi:hypothetical protein
MNRIYAVYCVLERNCHSVNFVGEWVHIVGLECNESYIDYSIPVTNSLFRVCNQATGADCTRPIASNRPLSISHLILPYILLS